MSSEVQRGMPDFVRPVAIAAQLIADLKVDIVAQTLANLKVDIVAQSITALNVSIVSTNVVIPVSIESSAVTFNVNITNSQVTLNTSFAAQTIGVKTEDVWAAEVGYLKTAAWGCTTRAPDYACWDYVPAASPNKTFYLSMLTISPRWVMTKSSYYVTIYDPDTGQYFPILMLVDNVGRSVTFVPPLKIPYPKKIYFFITNAEQLEQSYGLILVGWEK